VRARLGSLVALAALCVAAAPLAAQGKSSGYRASYITVEDDIYLEVLDWGGTGQPVIFLAGNGGTAHAFEQIAPKLTNTYHVYAITRRGFGVSSHPHTGYGADRLGDDVLAIIDSLKITRPVLAGHSIAGEELSSVATRHPEKVAGLVYLDAAYQFAYYDSTIHREVRSPGAAAPPPLYLPTEVMRTEQAIREGAQHYTDIRVPVLAIYALPRRIPPDASHDAKTKAEFRRGDSAAVVQIEAFQRGVPQARVVRLPNADHMVYISNEADVIREMRAFIDGLPQPRASEPARTSATELSGKVTRYRM
jgi:non-heme chloroperoxidase